MRRCLFYVLIPDSRLLTPGSAFQFRRQQLQKVSERLLVLILMLNDHVEDVAVTQQRVRAVVVNRMHEAQRFFADARQVAVDFGDGRQVAGVFARRFDGIEDRVVTRRERRVAFDALQNPIGFERADVAEVPEERAKAISGRAAQVAFSDHQIEHRASAGARPAHGFGDRVHIKRASHQSLSFLCHRQMRCRFQSRAAWLARLAKLI